MTRRRISYSKTKAIKKEKNATNDGFSYFSFVKSSMEYNNNNIGFRDDDLVVYKWSYWSCFLGNLILFYFFQSDRFGSRFFEIRGTYGG